MIELVRRMREAQSFLRMAAIELGRIAEQAPENSGRASAFGAKVEAEAEAEDLARRNTK